MYSNQIKMFSKGEGMGGEEGGEAGLYVKSMKKTLFKFKKENKITIKVFSKHEEIVKLHFEA